MSAPERLTVMDGLRGWLSVMVMVSHVAALRWMPFPDTPDPPNALTAAVFALGAPAVDAFFVLSGLVVSLSLERRARPYLYYLAARAWRLLPVGVVGLLLAPLIRWCAGHVDGGELLEVLRQPLSAQDWRGILTAGLLPFNANRLNPPLWSLIIEQHVALLMPLLLWVTRQGGAVTAVFLGACVMFSGHWYALWFVPAFTLGVLIRHLRVPSPWAWMVLLLALGLWQHRLITGDDPLYRFTASLGAAALLVALRSLPPQSAPVTVLCTPWSQWLGQVSFSLYVTHFAVLMLGAMLTPHVPWVGAALAVPLSFLLAALVHHLIERPLVTSRSGPAPVRQ